MNPAVPLSNVAVSYQHAAVRPVTCRTAQRLAALLVVASRRLPCYGRHAARLPNLAHAAASVSNADTAEPGSRGAPPDLDQAIMLPSTR